MNDSVSSDRALRQEPEAVVGGSGSWIAVKGGRPPVFGPHNKVDVWMSWSACALTMGQDDAFRVPDAWIDGGKWFHYDRGQVKELNREYITHWMLRPAGPHGETSY